MTAQPSQTLVTILEESARKYAGRPALIARRGYRTRTWTYSDLWRASERAAAVLTAHGARRGDRAVLWAENDALWAIGFLGLLRLGAIAVPLDVRSALPLVREIVTQTEPRLALLGPTVLRRWQDGMDLPGVPIGLLEDHAEGAPAGAADEAEPADLAEIIFTSGTTGRPKGVMLSHANIVANVRALAQVMPPLPSDRLISLLPLSHMLEQTIGLLLPLSGGAIIAYPGSRRSAEIFRTLREEQATTMVLVPEALRLFLEAIEREVSKAGREEQWRFLCSLAPRLPMPARRLLFSSLHRRLGGHLRFIVCGGAYLDPDLARRWEALGIPIIQGYGATEAAPVITGTSIDERRIGSVGKALPGEMVRISEDGEILVRGPNITSGYWQNPEATAEALRDGWYCTGDLGQLDSNGYLSLRGRKKDLIVLPNGLNVYAEDVERALCAAGARDAAVFGIEERAAVRVHAVLLGPGTQSEGEEVVRQANATLAEHQRVHACTLWPGDDFPRTTTLKVKKPEVLAWLRQEAAEPARPAEASPGPTLQRVLSRVAQVPLDVVRPGAALADLGLDSLARVELLAELETELGATVDEDRVTETTTVAQLEELIQLGGAPERHGLAQWPLAAWARGTRRVLQDTLLLPALRLLGGARAEGIEHFVDTPGPLLFAANHVSHLDAPAVLAGLPPSIRQRVALAAAADYFFDRAWLGITVAVLLNAFPFARVGAVRPTLQWCGYLADHGWSLLVFPKGTRSQTGEMGPFRSGIGLMAVELGLPVVPVRVQGTYQALPKGAAWPRPSQVRVRFGPPLRFRADSAYEEAAQAIEDAVRAL